MIEDDDYEPTYRTIGTVTYEDYGTGYRDLVTCSWCYAAVEEGVAYKHTEWHLNHQKGKA